MTRPTDLPRFANVRDGDLILTPDDDNRGERMLGVVLLLTIFAGAFLIAGSLLAWVAG